MIYKLSKKEFDKALPLFEGLRYNLVIKSVITGNTPGEIYVDNKDKPKTALLWNKMGTIMLEGEVSAGLAEEIHQVIEVEWIPTAKRKGVPEMNLYYHPASLKNTVKNKVLASKEVEKAERYFFILNKLNSHRRDFASKYSLRKIDEKLMEKNYTNSESVLGWISSFWHTYKDFYEKGIGFCVLDEDIIASWCLSVYVSGKEYEFGIATAPEYRNKGLGKLTASACIEKCLNNNWIPYWHCNASNKPSVAVAKGVGFEIEKDYQVFSFKV